MKDKCIPAECFGHPCHSHGQVFNTKCGPVLDNGIAPRWPSINLVEGIRIVPWIECNNESQLANVIEGLQVWREITDTAIVSTKQGRSWFYHTIMAGVPDMRIIPGMKTVNILQDNFDSAERWHKVREEIVACLGATGEQTVLFEHESAVDQTWDQVADNPRQEIDLGELRVAIEDAQFPDHVTYLWYPSVPARLDSEVQVRAADICRVAQNALAPIFMDGSMVGPYDPERAETRQRASGLLREVAGWEPVPKTNWYGTEKPYWLDEQIEESLNLVRTPAVIVYPARSRWVLMARLFVQVAQQTDLIAIAARERRAGSSTRQ